MSKSKLLYIPLTAPFIKEFARFFLGNETAPEKSAVVFSNRRPFFYFQKEIASLKGKPVLAPGMMSMDDFVNSLVEEHFRDCNRADELDALWLLYSIIREHGSDFPAFDFPSFDKFISWGRHIYRFLNLVDTELVSSERLGSIQDAAEKGFDIPESINRILSNIRLLRKLFHQRLEGEKLTTRGYVYYHALELASDMKNLDFEQVWFAGLFGLTATEKNFIKRLMDADKASLVWHGNPTDWKVLTELEKFFGREAEPVEIPVAQKEEDIRFFSVPNYHIQALKTADVMRSDGKIEDTVVVVTDITGLQPVLNFIVSPLLEEDKVADFNITIGYGIDRTSFFGLLELIIRLQITARNEPDGVLYYVPDYMALLRHPFIRNLFVSQYPDGMRDAAKLLKEIFLDDEGPLYKKIFTSPGEIESLDEVKSNRAIFSSIQNLHSHLLKPFENCVSLGQLAKRTSQALKFILSGSHESSYVLSGEIIASLLEKLRERELSRSGQIEMSPHLSGNNSRLIYNIFLEQFSGQTVNFETSPLQPLEIMGMLETRNLNFKNVIVLNCEEGILPKEREIDPLIPVSIYPWLNLPPVENSEEMYRYYFFRLIGAAEKVRLFYTKREDSFRSRFIEELIWKKQKAENSAENDHVEDAHFKITAYRKPDGLMVEKTDDVLKILAGLEFSPSLIKSYLDCPLVLYYKRILKFEENKEFSVDIDAAEAGLVIHDILERTFKPFLGKVIGPEMRKEFMKSFFDASREALALKSRYSGEFLLLEKVIEKKLESFLERHLSECAGHQILSLEDHKRWRHEFDTGKNRVLLKGTIDRIDLEPASGRRIVYDYKSGISGSKKYSDRKIGQLLKIWNDAKTDRFEATRKYIRDFQLPVYLWLVNEGGPDFLGWDAALLFLRDDSTERFFDLGKSDLTSNGYHQAFMDGLKVVIDHVLDPRQPFKRFEDTDCENCPFGKMCRSKV